MPPFYIPSRNNKPRGLLHDFSHLIIWRYNNHYRHHHHHRAVRVVKRLRCAIRRWISNVRGYAIRAPSAEYSWSVCVSHLRFAHSNSDRFNAIIIIYHAWSRAHSYSKRIFIFYSRKLSNNWNAWACKPRSVTYARARAYTQVCVYEQTRLDFCKIRAHSARETNNCARILSRWSGMIRAGLDMRARAFAMRAR